MTIPTLYTIAGWPPERVSCRHCDWNVRTVIRCTAVAPEPFYVQDTIAINDNHRAPRA